jgi:hypothetical protein
MSKFSGIATSIRTFYHICRTSLPPTGGGGCAHLDVPLHRLLRAENRPGCNCMSPVRILVKIFNFSPYYSVTF